MDPERKEMRAVLVIGGPSIVSGKRIFEVPENIDLYPFMCHLLAIPSAPNNASMGVLSKALRVNMIVLPTTGLLYIGSSSASVPLTKIGSSSASVPLTKVNGNKDESSEDEF
ncbi:hypothetical protein NECAME_08095 [Necator americanus]|uniref:Uncharacterized protein n=1 Tax=Necator americanus TaxID=51031 RepID=W2TM00_NECAM|nr:hypothetical protein NECAME_08095 [Necator americanus]ETN82166.1 hypothetical protein NECAME_08095 [Necator americanus]